MFSFACSENPSKASEILENLDSVVPGLAMVKTRRANLERRLGNSEKVTEIYEKAIQDASDLETASFYSVRYSRFLVKVYLFFCIFSLYLT